MAIVERPPTVVSSLAGSLMLIALVYNGALQIWSARVALGCETTSSCSARCVLHVQQATTRTDNTIMRLPPVLAVEYEDQASHLDSESKVHQ